jgi:hypothetical protein
MVARRRFSVQISGSPCPFELGVTMEKLVVAEKICGSCGRGYSYWGRHQLDFGCTQPVLAERVPAKDPPPRNVALDLLYKEMESKLGSEVATMHLHKKISLMGCEKAVELVEVAVAHVVEIVRTTFASAGASNTGLCADITAIGTRTAAVLQELRKIDGVCEQHAPNALAPVERPSLASANASKKQFANFSLQQKFANFSVLSVCPSVVCMRLIHEAHAPDPRV